MQAQFGEDAEILSRLPGFRGCFVDIGACDFAINSNTRALHSQGWRGVLVEASVPVFAELLACHGDDPDLILVHAAVVEDCGPDAVSFRECGGNKQLGTTCQEHYTLWQREPGWKKPYVCASMRTSVLAGHIPADVNFINIDVEGRSIPVAMDLLLKHRVACLKDLCFVAFEREAHEPTERLIAELTDLGFAVQINSATVLMARDSSIRKVVAA